MIRDLRATATESRVRTPPDSPTLAFPRDRVARSEPFVAPVRTTHAYSIAITAPRLLTCKRGLAAHLATELASVADADSPVCVVDLDTESRDIGIRFGVSGPVLLDLAKRIGLSHSVEETITRVGPLSVLPTRLPDPPLAPLLRTKTPAVLEQLALTYDVLVVDAPVAVGIASPVNDRAILDHVDVLLVAVTADAAALGGALRYLNALAAAVDAGALPSTFETYLVLTGSEHDGSRTLSDDALEARLPDLPVLARVPQLWGRHRPEGRSDPHGDPATGAALAALIDVLVNVR